MTSASAAELSEPQRAALDTLVGDLRRIFGARLQSLVAYGVGAVTAGDHYVRTLGLVERVTFDDLARLAPLAAGWRSRGLAVPLILSSEEFARTLDVFPLEYGSIIASHVVIAGDNPFGATRVAEGDRRRGCEQQAKSHLIHLRDGFLETDGDPRHVARLISSSSLPFRTLLTNLAWLESGDRRELDPSTLAATSARTIGIPAPLIEEVLATHAGMGTMADPTALLSRYIEASERIWRYVDGWRA